MPDNKAAWIPAPKARLEVQPAPYPTPGPKDIIIKTSHVAINPLEYKIQDTNPPIGGKEIPYPTILGADLSGTVVEIGSEVSTRHVGDRVIANANGAQTGQPSRGGFQLYVRLDESNTTLLPVNVPFEAGAVLPLACDTAAAGLFVPEQLGLHTNALGGEATSSTAAGPGSVLLVWGGSSSVGCCAIQMAKAAGYEVYTTASKRNHDLVRSIGASKVFDHTQPDVESEITAALDGKTVIGAYDAIVDRERSFLPCAKILAKTTGPRKIAAVLNPPNVQLPEGVVAQRLSIPALRAGPVYKIVHDWMEKALANGSLQPKPNPEIVGEGFEYIQNGIDRMRKGVSATKLVIKV
ncbi:Zinc-binding alcohol dehydrogenase domain-containing protein cipB [Cercospora beticola]|uniref:Zinc-binding alcohol dehydrogenase domain-containing protein cipB n=1 Tax=Cercospora beticola TaxID=122368 RepID=A0A2G5HEH0_CERBT|nr:Zinc-binding alcohol dehydrogenase domain-containing protein cipB [Cercospora beticola]PIA90663.1 Zinc-binding alcohol dehydrogenase domain-containing protein cipB [Cercospora beticola]WPB08195.1 hypothetical protein RHO25_012859 [Cercospora beticola]CAK1367935.1 unnamed protein product [Cercospora beticola]